MPLEKSRAFDVFEADTVAVAAGDRIRITRNGMAASRGPSGRKQELRNGAIYEIGGFTDNGDLRVVHRDPKGKITSQVVIGQEFGNVTHGYCVTSHASQGKTVDRVLIAQGSESFPASSREQFYVSVSRGREDVVIYTDDKERLRDRVIDSAARVSATEFERERARNQARDAQEHVLWVQRLMSEARDYARRQTARMMERARSVTRPMERGHDGQERQL